MPGRTVVSTDRVSNTIMDADITHIREPIKCDACHAFIMRSITSRARIRANVRRRRRRCYLPIASLDGELTILYGNPQLGYRLLKALTDVGGRLYTRCFESEATARSFFTYTFNL